MREDQKLRGAVAGVVGAIYVTRTVVVGNGTISVFGHMAAPFGLTLLALVILAIPETIDMLPFGPTRSK